MPNSNKEYYTAFILDNKLIRFDAPGNIIIGYVAHHFSVSMSNVFFLSGIEEFIRSLKFDNDGDAYYLKMGYDMYKG
jgi:hypothetical protein